MSFGEMLKLLRSKRGITQDALAHALDIPASTIRRLETDDTALPRRERLEAIADYFNVKVDYLLGREPQEKDSADKLIDYLEMELTNEEIKERMTFKVDDITLSGEEVDEFVNWVRVQRLMKLQRAGAPSKSE